MKKLLLFLVAGGTIVFGAAFQNGGFETPVLSSSPDFGTLPSGWTKVDPTNFALFMQTYATFGLPTTGGEGNQAYGFGGNGGVAGDLSQTFDTVAGGNYVVTFQYLIQQGLEFEDLKAQVLDGAVPLATTSIRFNNRDWVTTTMNFTAGSSSTTLRFSDTTGAVDPGVGFSTNWGLDAVTVTRTDVVGVPEPSTFALLALGGLAALVSRRSRRSV